MRSRPIPTRAGLRDQRQFDRQFQIGLQFDRLAVRSSRPADGAAWRKRCRSRAKAVTARRAVASVSALGFSTTVPAMPSTTDDVARPDRSAPDLRHPAPPARPARAASRRCGPSAPPSSVATPASRDGSSNAASAGRSDSLTRIAPSGRPAKLRNGVRVRLRTSRRPISRTSSARRFRLGAVLGGHAGFGLAPGWRRRSPRPPSITARLGRQQGLLDPPPDAADQARGADHADDRRRSAGRFRPGFPRAAPPAGRAAWSVACATGRWRRPAGHPRRR